MERRQLLKRLGVVGGIVIGGAIVGDRVLDGTQTGDSGADDGEQPEPPDPGSIPHADEFATVVDAVGAGVDPSGEVPINGFLERNAADDTLLAFPGGTYRLHPIDLSEYTRLGVVAFGRERPTFVSAAGNCIEDGRPYVQFRGVEDLLLEGVTFDFDVPDSGGLVRVTATGDATVRDVDVAGSCAGQIALFRAEVLNPDGTLRVENVTIENAGRNPSLTGVYVGRDHAGTVVFRECRVRGFSDNGLYASAPGLDDGQGGDVRVVGGTYRNNNIANVRLGSDGSVARGVRSVSDEAPPVTPAGPRVNVRGIRLRNGREQLVEDCSVVLRQTSGFSYGGIVVHPENSGGTVRNSSVVVDRDATAAIRAFPPEDQEPNALVFENVEVTGTAAHDQTALIDSRNGTVFRGCTIDTTGEQRDGIVFWDVSNCRIADSTIDVTGAPIVLLNSTVTIENTTLRTPDTTRTIDQMTATDGDFIPQETV